MNELSRRSFLQGLVALVSTGCSSAAIVAPDYSGSAKSLSDNIRRYTADTDFYGPVGIGYATFVEVSGFEKKLPAGSNNLEVLVNVLPENVFASVSQKVVNINGVACAQFEIPYAKALDVRARLIQHRQDIIAWEEDFGFGSFGE